MGEPRNLVLTGVLALVLGCASSVEDEPGALTFMEPAPDSVVTRDVHNDLGEVVAPIGVELAVPPEIDHVELWIEAIGGNELLATLKVKADRPSYVGRPEAASPATGLHKEHVKQQDKLLDEALTV